MYMKKTALAILAMSMFAASSAMAAAPGSEISASGSIDSSTSKPGSTKSDSTNANLSYGYYLSSRLVARANVFMNLSNNNGTKSNTTYLGLGAKYYFGDAVKSAWVPYALADVLSVSSESTGSSISGYGYDAGVGVSNFITEAVSFDIEAKLYSNSLNASGYTLTQDGSRINFGFTARF